MVLFTHDVKICQIDQGATVKNGLKNVRCEQGLNSSLSYLLYSNVKGRLESIGKGTVWRLENAAFLNTVNLRCKNVFFIDTDSNEFATPYG